MRRSWRGWGPVRLVDRFSERHLGFDLRPHRVVAFSRDNAARTKPSTGRPPRFHEPGGGATRQARDATVLLRRCALCWYAHVRGSVSQIRSARAPPVADSLRAWLESPSPAIPVAPRRNDDPSGSASQTRLFRIANDPRNLPCVPTYETLARIARRASPIVERLPAFKGELRRTESRFACLAKLLSQAASLLSARPSDRAAHASQPPEGLGFAVSGAPRRAAEFSDTRGAFRRLTTCFDQAGLTPSAACG